MISFRAANRGWGHNLAPRVGSATTVGPVASDAVSSATVTDGSVSAASNDSTEASNDQSPDEQSSGGGAAGGDPAGVGSHRSPWRLHPIGWVAGGLLIVAVVYHTILDTKYLIGNLEWWQWIGLVIALAMAAWPAGLHGLQIGIDSIASVTKRISMFLAWFVFVVQLFNVVTRYGNSYVDQDILIGQATSLAWMSFASLFLLGANYGIRDGVNPRIDFWWANFTDRSKAWLDFVLHSMLFLPFVIMAIRILIPYAAISLGRKRDGTWPSGYKVWETWEQSGDADQLPVGPVKALLLVGFVLIAIQLVSELIKTGFVMAGRREYAKIKSADAPQRIE